MGKRGKLLEQLRNSPHNATFRLVRKVLEEEGFILERATGSHHVFKRKPVTFVIPVHAGKVKSIYVKRLIEIIDENAKETE